jgi:hypothetical protein
MKTSRRLLVSGCLAALTLFGCASQPPVNEYTLAQVDELISTSQSNIARLESLITQSRDDLHRGLESDDPLKYAISSNSSREYKDLIASMESDLISYKKNLSELYVLRARVIKEMR